MPNHDKLRGIVQALTDELNWALGQCEATSNSLDNVILRARDIGGDIENFDVPLFLRQVAALKLSSEQGRG